MKVVLVAFVFLSTATESAFSQNGQVFCKALVECSQYAESARSACGKLNPFTKFSSISTANSTASTPANSCAKNVTKISDMLVQKQQEIRNQQAACLNKHLPQAVLTGSTIMAGNAEGAVPDDKPLHKTEAEKIRLLVRVNPSHPFQQEECKKLAAEVTNLDKGHLHLLMKRASNGSAAAANSSGRGSAAPNSAPVAAGNKTATGSGAAENGTSEFAVYANCLSDADAKEAKCRQLATCCSEVVTCDFEYQLSKLHDQVVMLHYALYRQYRVCQQQKPQPQPPAAKPSQ